MVAFLTNRQLYNQPMPPIEHNTYNARFANRYKNNPTPSGLISDEYLLTRAGGRYNQSTCVLAYFSTQTMMLRGQRQIGANKQRSAARLSGAAQPRAAPNAALPSNKEQVGPCAVTA